MPRAGVHKRENTRTRMKEMMKRRARNTREGQEKVLTMRNKDESFHLFASAESGNWERSSLAASRHFSLRLYPFFGAKVTGCVFIYHLY